MLGLFWFFLGGINHMLGLFCFFSGLLITCSAYFVFFGGYQSHARVPSIDCALSPRIQEIIMILVMAGNLRSSVMLSSPKSPCTVASDPWGAVPGTSGCLIILCKYALPATSSRGNLPRGSALPPEKLILQGVPRGAKVRFCTPAVFAVVCRCLSRCAALLFK